MKRITTAISFAFFLIFGVLAYTQEPSDNNKPRQQEEQLPRQEQKPEPKTEHAKPTKQEEPKPSKTAKPEQEQPSQQEGAKHSHEERDQDAAQARQGRATGKGGHIPDDKFRASFGRQHTFVISRPVIVENRPRFQSGGFWFEIMAPWPTDWAYTDDCYVVSVRGSTRLTCSIRKPA
jgi:pyruvate/2-oxoglutarate dehydrogenase complex dihydrolipoamide acyltransferase (E2) component